MIKFERHFKLYLVAISFHTCNYFVYSQVLQPPAGYIPIRTPARRLLATPTPIAGTPTGFRIQTPDSKVQMVDMQPKGNLPMMKPDDMQYFDKLLVSFTLYLYPRSGRAGVCCFTSVRPSIRPHFSQQLLMAEI